LLAKRLHPEQISTGAASPADAVRAAQRSFFKALCLRSLCGVTDAPNAAKSALQQLADAAFMQMNIEFGNAVTQVSTAPGRPPSF